MNFFKNIRNSIYSPEFYSSVTIKTFKQTFGYFLLLTLTLSIIKLITLINPLLIQFPTELLTGVNNIINCYPKDLEIKITNGQVSINATEPYFISSCEEKNSEKFIVIDTKTPFSSTQFDDFNAGVWVTKDSIVYKKSKYETRSYSLTQIKDFKLNRTVLDSYSQKFSPFLKFVGPILLVLAFLGLFLAYDFRLLHLLLLAALIWLLSRIFKRSLGFGQSYKVGLYAITLGLIIDLIINLTQPWTNFSGFPFMVSILTLGVVTINLFLPKKSA